MQQSDYPWVAMNQFDLFDVQLKSQVASGRQGLEGLCGRALGIGRHGRHGGWEI